MTTTTSTVHVALLRGVNVSGKNKLPMAELARMFEDAGCRNVETYIQSGNVVFWASATRAGRIPSLVREAISERFGYHVPVVIRSAASLASMARTNPFVAEGADHETLHVAFLASTPTPSQLASLDPDRSPPDRFAARGAEIYLCCPNGLGRSKLTTTYFDAKLDTTTTIRNWRTVTRLLQMVDR